MNYVNIQKRPGLWNTRLINDNIYSHGAHIIEILMGPQLTVGSEMTLWDLFSQVVSAAILHNVLVSDDPKEWFRRG